jgi:hypothetical protein
MAAKLKIEKRGDETLIVHCCFSVKYDLLLFKKKKVKNITPLALFFKETSIK